MGEKQLSGLFFAMIAQCIDSKDKRKLLLKENTVFEAQRNDCISFSPRNIWERNVLRNQSPTIRDYEIFQAHLMIFLAFVSLNTLNSTLKKLLLNSGQAVVKLTNPPTSLHWVVASKATVNVYQCEPDPETARKGTKFSL